MARRRLYVFGGIIVVGVLIGFLFLPGENGPAPANQALPGQVAPVDRLPVPLPQANVSNTPSARAEALFTKALLLTDVPEKFNALIEAHRLDSTGRWGGEAAAELGNLCKATNAAQAREWYARAKTAPVSPETLAKISSELTETATAATGPVALEQVKTVPYKVQAGDALWTIAKRHGVTADAIKAANKLTSDLIRVGASLNIPQGPFDVRVVRREHMLYLLQSDKPVKAYKIALGANNTTPVGAFVVANKLKDPVWYSDQGRIPPGDPRNQLGTRWIGFDGQIGIHGTRKADENSIGTDASKGCVRMLDSDARELYDWVVEQKSKVIVVD